MKRFATVVIAGAVLFSFASTALGVIGWAGNIWPCNGQPYTSNDDINVYVQVWKDGCTGPVGPCADIQATLFYRCTGAPEFISVPMVYNVPIGNNDEFTGTIPSGHGCSEVEFYVEVVDVTDGDTWYPGDQCGNGPNFFLPITEVTSQDVTVTFHLCLSGETTTSGAVCVTGSHEALTNWGDGVPMMFSCEQISPKLYEVDVLFAAGSNPYVEYKYKKDDCQTWESTGNHSFTIDDSAPTQDLWVDGWEYIEPDCPDCASPVEDSSWGTIKGLYR